MQPAFSPEHTAKCFCFAEVVNREADLHEMLNLPLSFTDLCVDAE
jgi:hypothetical protein